MERSASTHEHILKLAAEFDASMSWQERIMVATKLYNDVTDMLDK
jgi:hypothetical protein